MSKNNAATYSEMPYKHVQNTMTETVVSAKYSSLQVFCYRSARKDKNDTHLTIFQANFYTCALELKSNSSVANKCKPPKSPVALSF